MTVNRTWMGSIGIQPQSGAFGEAIVAELEARVQIDAVYGIQDSDALATAGGAGSGATGEAGLFVTRCGTDVGGMAQIVSTRLCRYRPGQGIRARFTAEFDAGVAGWRGLAGVRSVTEGVHAGYNGATFGVFCVIAGAQEFQTFTITAGATGVGTIVIELDGVSVNVPIGGALSVEATAATIAAVAFAGWTVTAAGAVVTFVAEAPEVKAGAFSFAAGGSGATATVAQVLVGAPNDYDLHFKPQADWNGEPVPWFDPSKLNIWQIVIPYLGGGSPTIELRHPWEDRWVLIHTYNRPNLFEIPNARNPTYRIGWCSTSISSTTDLRVRGASGAVFVEGKARPMRHPHAFAKTALSVTTKVVIAAIRNRCTFGGIVNMREMELGVINASIEGTKPGIVRIYLDGTISGLPLWEEVGPDSCADTMSTAGLAHTGGHLIGAIGRGEIDLAKLAVRLNPGEQIVITGEVDGGGGGNITSAAGWLEH